MISTRVAEGCITSPSQAIVKLPDIMFCEVVSTPDPARNWVIIDNRISHTKGPYRIGDEVEGVRILEIHNRRVVVRYQGVTFQIQIKHIPGFGTHTIVTPN